MLESPVEGSPMDEDEDIAEPAVPDEAELDERQGEIVQAVDRVVEGEDVRAVLGALLARFPEEARDAVIARFRRRIEELNQEYARRRAEEERRRARGTIIDGELFNLASAVLLMATGTYEGVAGLLRQRPDLETQVADVGRELLSHGMKPDMKMVRRLQEIYARAIREQREREAREREAGPDTRPAG